MSRMLIASPLIGTWLLESYTLTFASGQTVAPLGTSPSGLIVYTETGWVSVHMYNAARPAFAVPDPTNTTPDGAKAALDGSVAYFGTYTIDPSQQIVRHQVRQSVFPNFANTTMHRKYEVTDTLLRLVSDPMPAASRGTVVADITWRKTGATA
jgi:hypothetical protein